MVVSNLRIRENTQRSGRNKQTSLQQNEQNIKRISNGFLVSKSFHRYISLQKMVCLTLAIKLLVVFFYYQHSYIDSKCSVNTKLLYMIHILSLIVCGLYGLSHSAYNQFKRCEKKQHEQSGTGSLILGLINILIQPVSVLEDIETSNWNYSAQIDQKIKLNYILVLMTIFNLGTLISGVMNTLKFKNPRSSRVCKIYGCENSILYQLKCYFKQSPIRLVVILLFSSILFFTLCFRIAERNVNNPNHTFEYIQNLVWLVIVTMTSVGYGDYAPQTLIGRIIGVGCVFWGVLTVSIMVLVVVNTFELDPREQKSLKILKKLQQKEKIKKIAGEYISCSLSRIWRNKKYQRQMAETQNQRNLKKILKQLLRSCKFNDASGLDLSEQMSIHFERVLYGIQSLSKNSEAIINYLNNQYFINIDSLNHKDNILSKKESN